MACTMSSIAQAFFGEKPKLVVGIVVDQMRWDYLDRYYNQFTNDGFRRLINEGYSCDNCLINYLRDGHWPHFHLYRFHTCHARHLRQHILH